MLAPRRRPSSILSDQKIVELVNEGSIVVDFHASRVFKNGRELRIGIVGTEGKNGTRHRVQICAMGVKRTIVLAKLVYMAWTKRVIPDGFVIHHIDGDRYRDTIDNLVMLTVEDHNKLHRAAEAADDTPF